MENLRKQWNEACLQTGIPALTLPTCARIMAILYHYGNNEAFVLNSHFMADCEYVQNRFHLKGGETPDVDFVEEYAEVNALLEDCDTPPQWAKTLMKEMYNINI